MAREGGRKIEYLFSDEGSGRDSDPDAGDDRRAEEKTVQSVVRGRRKKSDFLTSELAVFLTAGFDALAEMRGQHWHRPAEDITNFTDAFGRYLETNAKLKKRLIESVGPIALLVYGGKLLGPPIIAEVRGQVRAAQAVTGRMPENGGNNSRAVPSGVNPFSAPPAAQSDSREIPLDMD